MLELIRKIKSPNVSCRQTSGNSRWHDRPLLLAMAHFLLPDATQNKSTTHNSSLTHLSSKFDCWNSSWNWNCSKVCKSQGGNPWTHFNNRWLV